MADRKTELRRVRITSQEESRIPLRGAFEVASTAAAHQAWRDGQVEGPDGFAKSWLTAWRDREGWRPAPPATTPEFSPPVHQETGDEYAARLVEWLAPAASSTPSEIVVAEAIVEAFVLSAIGHSNFQNYAWFWSGACVSNYTQAPDPTPLDSGAWVAANFAFKGPGLEDDPLYCPV